MSIFSRYHSPGVGVTVWGAFGAGGSRRGGVQNTGFGVTKNVFGAPHYFVSPADGGFAALHLASKCPLCHFLPLVIATEISVLSPVFLVSNAVSP